MSHFALTVRLLRVSLVRDVGVRWIHPNVVGQEKNWMRIVAIAIAVACLLCGCDQPDKDTAEPRAEAVPEAIAPETPNVTQDAAPASPPIVSSARAQVGKTTIYDPAYVRLGYPGGDVPIDRGVCTDVVVRALRDALGMDLQKLVHDDMTAAFSKYPKIWGLRNPDRNIDHRRVPNLRCYFRRKGFSIAATKDKRDYLPGDLVTCTVPPNRPHIMIVSDRKTEEGLPLVIHNIGRGAAEEPGLFAFPVTGHYRIKREP